MRTRRERGEGQIGCLVGIVLLLLAALIAYRMIPIKVKAAELRDTIVDEAKSAGQHDDKQIRAAIINKAEQLGLPVSEGNIEIRRKDAYIVVRVNYAVPVNFPGYVYQWKFDQRTENPIF